MTARSELPPVDGHEIVREIGRGAMGAVYLAKDLSLNRPVAVKVLLGADFASPETLARFRHESEAVARLRHPNVVQVFASGTTDGTPWFSMELVEDARPLAPNVASGPGGVTRAVRVVAKVARALHHAHERGIVHRDLKPANILLDAAGEPHVTDFGVARWWRPDADGSSKRLTIPGTLLGTAAYMAPEQAQGDAHAVGPPTDVWALGVVLYEMLTGRTPFAGATQLETLARILREDAPSPAWARPEIPRDLEAVSARCLRRSPPERYVSAVDLAADLEAVADGRPLPSKVDTPSRKGWFGRLFGGG
jgi:serine/threonine protein kinase